ncbi:hypothetical protein GCM10009642_38240 [Nocardiopsis metallicus]
MVRGIADWHFTVTPHCLRPVTFGRDLVVPITHWWRCILYPDQPFDSRKGCHDEHIHPFSELPARGDGP